MDISEYYRLAKVEDSHWWYQSVHRLVIDEIRKSFSQGWNFGGSRSNLKPLAILDAGCGTGGLTEKLSEFGNTTGIDISDLALRLKKNSKAKYINGSINDLPFITAGFDMVTCVSVFYHRRVSDSNAVSEIFRALKNGDRAILIMPAFQWVFGSHDKSVHSAKRYSMSEAVSLLQNAGFAIIKRRYIFGLLFPVFVIKRLMDKIGVTNNKISDLSEVPNWLNYIIEQICRFENWLSEWIRFPFGSTIYIVAGKL